MCRLKDRRVTFKAPTYFCTKEESRDLHLVRSHYVSAALDVEEDANHVLIDCRSAAGYHRSHIFGAINIGTIEQLLDFYIQHSSYADKHPEDAAKVIVFYSEYPRENARYLASCLHALDLMIHEYDASKLVFTNIVVLMDAFSVFQAKHPRKCKEYVETYI